MHRALLAAILVSTATGAYADTPTPTARGDGESLGIVAFSRASTRLTESARDEAADIAAWQQKHPDSILIIEGHTARLGSWNKNLRVSQDRTDAVRQALVEAGADPARMVLAARGDDPDRTSSRITGHVVIRATGGLVDLAREQRDVEVGEDARAARRTMNDQRSTGPAVRGRAVDQGTTDENAGAAPPAAGVTTAPTTGGNTIVIVPGRD